MGQISMNKCLGMLLFLLVLSLAACKINSSDTKIQYMPDMADSPVIDSQGGFIDPPDHSIATGAILYPENQTEAGEVLKNPVPSTPETIAEGKRLWMIFCKNCHGLEGQGDGTLGPTYPYPPTLITDPYRAMADGSYYYHITKGGSIMPAYGNRVSSEERWQIINYIRSLQNKG